MKRKDNNRLISLKMKFLLVGFFIMAMIGSIAASKVNNDNLYADQIISKNEILANAIVAGIIMVIVGIIGYGLFCLLSNLYRKFRKTN